KQMDVQPGVKDYLLFLGSNLYFMPKVVAHRVAGKIPVVRGIADKLLIHQINELLVGYGHAEYTTDPSKYKDTGKQDHHGMNAKA
ncbi:MAG: hypothetical protein Q8J78_06430, partial [Moraxellaceae bacterium]|nr:hypothetical protein [Moraxellaceae bacterium]